MYGHCMGMACMLPVVCLGTVWVWHGYGMSGYCMGMACKSGYCMGMTCKSGHCMGMACMEGLGPRILESCFLDRLAKITYIHQCC